jgi:hypothetical protein
MSGPHLVALRKFATVQLAAQALLARGANGAAFGSHWTSSGGFTNAHAEGFIDVWRLVSMHVDATAGFAGALFMAKRGAYEQGVASGELVLSLHASHAVAQAGAAIGAAAPPKFFAQLTALERWAAGVRSLRMPRHQLTLTNHPNGWHLAAGFNLLYPGRALASYTLERPEGEADAFDPDISPGFDSLRHLAVEAWRMLREDQVPGSPTAANDAAF